MDKWAPAGGLSNPIRGADANAPVLQIERSDGTAGLDIYPDGSMTWRQQGLDDAVLYQADGYHFGMDAKLSVDGIDSFSLVRAMNGVQASGDGTAGKDLILVKNNLADANPTFRVRGNGETLIAGPLDHDGNTIGFYGVAPVARGAAVANAAGGTVQDAEARAAINACLARLRAVGLINP